jgi:predicted transcriptional regulator
LLADEEIKLPPEIIEGVLHQGLKGVLGSNSKARKTWILLDAAISVATGQPFWKWRTCKGRVLYINFEIPRAFIRWRIQRVCESKGVADVANLDVWTLRGHGAALWSLLPAMLAKIETGKYLLIIIDPIYKALGGRDENSAGDIGELCNELEQIAVATGAAVLFAAYFSKGNQAAKEAIDRIGGSGVWGRDPDTIITLTKHQVEGAFTVDLILRNLPEQKPFVVEWNFPIMKVAPEFNPEELKQVAGRKKEHDPRKLLSVIAETTDEKPISMSAWAAAGNIARQTLADYVPEMRKKGWIATTGEGNAARQYLTEKGRNFVEGRA